jgi:hypothetical protein
MDNQQPQQKQPYNLISYFKNIRSGKPKSILLFGAGLIIVIGIGLYGYISRKDNTVNNSADSATQVQSKPQLSVDDQIKQVQDELLKGKEDFTLRFTLAKLYHTKGNKNKAIFNYEKAKALAKPSDEAYVANVSEIDAALKELREGQ